MDRAVVFGGTGLIGSAIARRLADTGLTTLILGSEVDLSAPSARQELTSLLRHGDVVIMAAAKTPVQTTADVAANVAMVHAVASAVGARGVEHVTYLSSDAVYPRSDGPVTESTAPAPPEVYGEMHLEREALLSGRIPCLLIIRPTLVYGGRPRRLNYGIDRMCREARSAGAIALIGDGEEQRDHVHVDDVAALVERLVRTASVGIVNAVSGVSVSYARLADAVAMASKRNISIRHVPRTHDIWHRSFDTTLLEQVAPDLHLRSPEAGAANEIRRLESRMKEEEDSGS